MPHGHENEESYEIRGDQEFRSHEVEGARKVM